ncbi:resistin [Lithobates pipiens]
MCPWFLECTSHLDALLMENARVNRFDIDSHEEVRWDLDILNMFENMASLTLLVCCLLVASTYSQPAWLGGYNIFGPGFEGGYPVSGRSRGNSGGYPVPGGSGGNSGGYPGPGGSGGNSGGYPVPGGSGGNSGGYPVPGGSGGHSGGRPSTGGNGGYPGGRPSTGGNGGYPGGRPSTAGNGGYPGGRPSTGIGGGYEGGSTNTGGSECKCKIPELKCIDSKANGINSKCPAGYTATSCSCANGCGTSIFPSPDSCRCECFEVDWTLARCCKNV